MCVFMVGSVCVGAAPGLYPSGQVGCPSAALTGSAAAAPGSSLTHSPIVHSLLTSHVAQENIVSNAKDITDFQYILIWYSNNAHENPMLPPPPLESSSTKTSNINKRGVANLYPQLC